MICLRIWMAQIKAKFLISMTKLEIPTANTNGRPLTYCEVLSLILVTLKCLGLISCNWVVPFIPIILPIIFYGILFGIGAIRTLFNKTRNHV